jgi:hypothetical protein
MFVIAATFVFGLLLLALHAAGVGSSFNWRNRSSYPQPPSLSRTVAHRRW